MGHVDLNESRVTIVTVCYSIPIPIMITCTGLRLFVKLRPSSKNSIAFDDLMIIIATVSATIYLNPFYPLLRAVHVLTELCCSQ